MNSIPTIRNEKVYAKNPSMSIKPFSNDIISLKKVSLIIGVVVDRSSSSRSLVDELN